MSFLGLGSYRLASFHLEGVDSMFWSISAGKKKHTPNIDPENRTFKFHVN